MSESSNLQVRRTRSRAHTSKSYRLKLLGLKAQFATVALAGFNLIMAAPAFGQEFCEKLDAVMAYRSETDGFSKLDGGDHAKIFLPHAKDCYVMGKDYVCTWSLSPGDNGESLLRDLAGAMQKCDPGRRVTEMGSGSNLKIYLQGKGERLLLTIQGHNIDLLLEEGT